MNAAICSEIVAIPLLPESRRFFSTPLPSTPLRGGGRQDLVRVQLVNGDGIRGTPLKAQVTEDAFILILAEYGSQSASCLEDADRAHRYTGRARLPLPTASLIHA